MKKVATETGLTFHLFDAPQRILERVDGAGLALAPLFRRQVHLQLLQGLEELLLCLRFGWLFAAAEGIHETDTSIEWQGLTSAHSGKRSFPVCTAEQEGLAIGVWGDWVMRGSTGSGTRLANPTMKDKVWDTNLHPLVEGLSCSELTRLKALELLGGEGLWEFEL